MPGHLTSIPREDFFLREDVPVLSTRARACVCARQGTTAIKRQLRADASPLWPLWHTRNRPGKRNRGHENTWQRTRRREHTRTHTNSLTAFEEKRRKQNKKTRGFFASPSSLDSRQHQANDHNLAHLHCPAPAPSLPRTRRPPRSVPPFFRSERIPAKPSTPLLRSHLPPAEVPRAPPL